MPGGLESLGIIALAEGVPEFVRRLGEMRGAEDSVAAAGESLGSRITSLGDTVLRLGTVAIGAAAAGIAALVTGIAAAVREAAQEEVVLTRITGMLETSGRASEFSAVQAEALAIQYRDLAGGSDDAVLAIEEMALRMGNVTAREMPDFIQTVLDLAAATGTDATSAARILATSMEYPTAALRRFRTMGILVREETLAQMQAYEDAGNTAGAYGLLLQAISRSTMGQAARRAATLTGQIEILRGHIADTIEQIGNEVMPVAKDLMQTILVPLVDRWLPLIANAFRTHLLPWIERAANALKALVDAGPLSIEFFEALGGIFPRVGEAIRGLIANLIPLYEGIRDFVTRHKDEIIGAIEGIGAALAAAGIVALVAKIVTAITTVAAAVGGPIGIIIAAIALLAAAWRGNWLGMRDTITAWWERTGKPIFETIVAWVQERIPEAVAALSTIWSSVFLPALQTAWQWVQTNVFPILQTLWSWIQEQIPLAIQFLRDAWNNNLMPVWETFMASMQENVFPVIQQLIAWFQENLPVAIQTLSDFWTNTLQPAIGTFWDWYTTVIYPKIQELAMWLAENIPVAIRTLADFWIGTLLPALQQVWGWMSTTLLPFLASLSDFISATLGYAIRALAALWTNILWPALQEVWRELAEHVGPILRELADVILPAIQDIWGRFTQTLRDSTEPLRIIADYIRNLELPDWLTPGSPTPFELALKGINAQMTELAKINLPTLNAQIGFARPMVAAPAVAGATTNNYTLNIATSARAEPIAADFKLLASLRGR